jgi:prepilin-type N-terminal cleavage/methylation domain-containing protein
MLPMPLRNHNPGAKQAGFTIIELMIATTVLSIILLVASSVFLGIGTLYSKGSTASNLQNNLRNVVQSIGNSVEFSSDPITNNNSVTTLSVNSQPITLYSVCIGADEYNYVTGVQQGSNDDGNDVMQHVLWKDTVTAGTCPSPDQSEITTAALPTGDIDLALPYEVVDNMSVGTGDSVSIDIEGTLAPPNGSDLYDPSTGQCNGAEGDQFCASAELSTTISRRLST